MPTMFLPGASGVEGEEVSTPRVRSPFILSNQPTKARGLVALPAYALYRRAAPGHIPSAIRLWDYFASSASIALVLTT